MKEELKKEAIALRKEGHSFKEISLKLKISRSTASLWLRNLSLNKKAKNRLEKRSRVGRLKGIESNRLKRKALAEGIEKKVKKDISLLKKNISLNKLFCSLLFWGEGSKGGSDVRFTNSDPDLIKTFLTLLRSSFQIDEKKFRVILHLHEYHNRSKQIKYWSKLTRISEKLFGVYLKPHTGKNKKNGYSGCASLRYYDYKIALELKDYYKFFSLSLRD